VQDSDRVRCKNRARESQVLQQLRRAWLRVCRRGPVEPARAFGLADLVASETRERAELLEAEARPCCPVGRLLRDILPKNPRG
jgi:hypothetical protein